MGLQPPSAIHPTTGGEPGNWPQPAAERRTRQVQAAVAGALAHLPVVVGVSFDIRMQRAVIVIREVKTGRVVQQIPPESAALQLKRLADEVGQAVSGKKD